MQSTVATRKPVAKNVDDLFACGIGIGASKFDKGCGKSSVEKQIAQKI